MQWYSSIQGSYYYHRRKLGPSEGTHYPGPVGSGVGNHAGWIKGSSVYTPGRETQSELIPGLLLISGHSWAAARPSGFGRNGCSGTWEQPSAFPAAPHPHGIPLPAHHFLWSKEGPGILRGATFSEILGPVATGAGQGPELSGLPPTRGLPVGAAHGAPAKVGLTFRTRVSCLTHSPPQCTVWLGSLASSSFGLLLLQLLPPFPLVWTPLPQWPSPAMQTIPLLQP